jgi:hypothetical protein
MRHLRILALALLALFACQPSATPSSSDAGHVGFPAGGFPPNPAQGNVLIYGAGQNAWLTPGAVGQVLQTQGANALPNWFTIPSADEGTLVPPPVASNWTHVNFGSGTTFVDSGSTTTSTVYLQDFTSGGADTAHCVTLARPGSVGTAYTLTVAIHPLQYPQNNSGSGIAIGDGTKLEVWQLVFVSGGVSMQFAHRNSATSFAANVYSAAWNIGQNARFWLRLKNDGTNRFFTYASDGLNFIPVQTIQDAGLMGTCGAPSTVPCYESNTTFINNNETVGGFCIDPESSIGSGATVESWSFTAP